MTPADHRDGDAVEFDEATFAPRFVELDPRDVGEQVDAEGFAPEHQERAWVLELLDCDLGRKPERGECPENARAVLFRGPHPEIQVLRQAWVAMGDDSLSSNEEVVDLMVVEQPAQFDPIGEEHRDGSSLPRIRGALRPIAASPSASCGGAPRGQPSLLPRDWRTLEFRGSPVHSTRRSPKSRSPSNAGSMGRWVA